MSKKLPNPTDPNLLARAVVEAAIGEKLTAKKHKSFKKQRKLRRKKT